MNNFINAINNLVTMVQPIGKPLLIVAVLVGGLCLMIPNQEFHAKAAKIIPGAMVGFALVIGAVELAATFASNF